ncbi:hypothetical protein CTAYLR_006902 [Chrysophaeum taylorii]|uniref:Uncharacterized protein n=1 Tax=Chrysophaeum taylorii TaxID=2483200 RepID=A0AAD7UHN1_9STRA|nr:hypothetical protein CTAYLR_006902 [Chrysophaeum taylorii]
MSREADDVRVLCDDDDDDDDDEGGLPVYDAAARRARLKALEMSAHRRAEYRSERWLGTVTDIRGRNLAFLAWPWVWIVVFSVAWTSLAPRRVARRATALAAAVSIVQSALAFLLVFRLARAAQRYWEARQAAGAMIASCRTLASTATASMGFEGSEVVRRLLAAFPVATKNYLRRVRGDERQLAGLVSSRDARALLDAECQPIWCVDAVRAAVVRWARRKGSHLEAHLASNLVRDLDDLTLHFGAMERINNTPLPFVYVAHLRVFLLVFLFALPVAYGGIWGWGTPLATALIAFALLGIEAAAVECERPFAREPNHFALEAFCVLVDANVHQTAAFFFHHDEPPAAAASSSKQNSPQRRRNDDGDGAARLGGDFVAVGRTDESASLRP